MSKVNWKQKYYELRSKYMNAIDVAFRLGVQEGQKNQKMMDMEMQLQQMQEAAAMGMGGEEEVLPPEEGGEPGMEGELPPEEMAAEGGGDELDASIDELEQYVKHEDKKDLTKLLKSFHENKKSGKIESKDNRAKKVNSILQKWDEEDAETQSDDNDVMGQA
jgi:hypothetical protein